MPAEQGNSRNRIKAARLTRYALFCAICLIVGYIESLLPLSFIAPGVKIGFSNAVALSLLLSGDTKGAFAVNVARILLSALLFGSPFSLVFSLAGGVASLFAALMFKRVKAMSEIGVSMVSGSVHNLVQLTVASFVTGKGVIYYLPVLLISGALTGAFVGYLTRLLVKKLKTNGVF